jgi:NhaP-type Na+/H+ or K+/H+ antiporter
MLWAVPWHGGAWWLVPLLLLVVRPLAVALGLLGSPSTAGQRWLIGWFGIRGVGSLYYLMYAVNHGVPAALVDPLITLTLSVVVVSILVHGVSVTPLMNAYEKAAARRRRR